MQVSDPDKVGGKKNFTPKLFVNFRLPDHIPDDNFYKILKDKLDLRFVYKSTERVYGKTGRPSLDPVVFFKMLLVGYLENICSDSIHQANETVITKDKISVFADKLPDHFIRIHSSCIVNRQMCTACTAHDVEVGEKDIPIGGRYKEEVMGRLRSDA